MGEAGQRDMWGNVWGGFPTKKCDDPSFTPRRKHSSVQISASDSPPLPSRASQTPANATMLYLVGLGLGDETDITLKGLEVVKKSARVYLEAYTSILLVDKTILVRSLYFSIGLELEAWSLVIGYGWVLLWLGSLLTGGPQ